MERGIDFIDLAGNLSINVPGKLLIQRIGQKTPEKRPLRGLRKVAPKAGWLVRQNFSTGCMRSGGSSCNGEGWRSDLDACRM
jgi:hypothetical protein